jgi:hypothetical protein
MARYRARAAERHPGHHDLARLDTDPPWLSPPATEAPELGVPCLRVDTAAHWDQAAIVAWVRAHLTVGSW